MKILENNVYNAAEQRTIKRIDRIIELVNEAKFIVGDTKEQRRRLTMARRILDSLIDDLKGEDVEAIPSSHFDRLTADDLWFKYGDEIRL